MTGLVCDLCGLTIRDDEAAVHVSLSGPDPIGWERDEYASADLHVGACASVWTAQHEQMAS